MRPLSGEIATAAARNKVTKLLGYIMDDGTAEMCGITRVKVN